MSSTDKTKLDGIATGANNYTLPLAVSGTRGGIQIGYTASGANIPLQLLSEKAYVALTKSAIENVLTGDLTSHTHDGRYYTESEINSLFLDYITSSNSVTTLNSLPITKRSVIASVTGATTLSLANTLPEGRFLTIKVYNTSGSSITQPLPTTSPFECKKTDGTDISSITIAAGGSAEISIWSLNSKYVIKTDG